MAQRREYTLIGARKPRTGESITQFGVVNNKHKAQELNSDLIIAKLMNYVLHKRDISIIKRKKPATLEILQASSIQLKGTNE